MKRTYYTIEGNPPEIIRHQTPPEREHVTDEDAAGILLRKYKVIELAKDYAGVRYLCREPLWPIGDRFSFVLGTLRKHCIRAHGPKVKADLYKLFERTAIAAFNSLGTKVS